MELREMSLVTKRCGGGSILEVVIEMVDNMIKIIDMGRISERWDEENRISIEIIDLCILYPKLLTWEGSV